MSKTSINNKIQATFRVFHIWSSLLHSNNQNKNAIEESWAKSLKNNSEIQKKISTVWKGINLAINNPNEYVHSMPVAAVAAGCQSMNEYYFRWARGDLKFIEGFESV